MDKKIIKRWLFSGWSWKSFFVGIFCFIFPFAVVWNVPMNQTRMLIDAGVNPFWLLTYLMSVIPLAFIALRDILKYQSSQKAKRKWLSQKGTSANKEAGE